MHMFNRKVAGALALAASGLGLFVSPALASASPRLAGPTAVYQVATLTEAVNQASHYAMVPFQLDIKDLAPGHPLLVSYSGGFVTYNIDGHLVLMRGDSVAAARVNGAFSAEFVNPGILAEADSSTVTGATITDHLLMTQQPLTGRPVIPSGTTVTLTNEDTHQTVELKNGTDFSIGSGVAAAAAARSNN